MRILDHYLRPRASFHQLVPVLREYCIRMYGDSLCAVFVIGSYASGRQGPSSDIDLLIVVDSSTESRPHRAHSFGEPTGYRGPELSPIVFTKWEFLTFPSFVLTLMDAHKTVYSRTCGTGDEAASLVKAGEAFQRIGGDAYSQASNGHRFPIHSIARLRESLDPRTAACPKWCGTCLRASIG